jgi:hypothetical protein
MAAAASGANETWTVPEVYLLTVGPDGAGTVAVPQLILSFFRDGIEVDRADGEEVWSRAWTDLAEMWPSERSVLPGGGDGVVVTIVERAQRRRHRFVLGTGDPDTTELFIRDLARAHGLRSTGPERAVSRLLTAALVVVFAAVLTTSELRPRIRVRRAVEAAGRQASDALRNSSNESSAVWLPPHWGQCSTWRHERSSRVPSGLSRTTNDSEMGSISSP